MEANKIKQSKQDKYNKKVWKSYDKKGIYAIGIVFPLPKLKQ